jgi:hypothetical protein
MNLVCEARNPAEQEPDWTIKKAGEHIMKKVLFSVLVVFVVMCSCSIVFAQGRDKTRGRRGRDWRAERAKQKRKGREADANESVGQDKGKRTRGRKRPRKMRGMMRKGREEFKAGKGTTQKFKAAQKQIAREKAKHLRRLVWMKRIRELALEEGNEDVVKRVDMLRQKEMKRHEHKRGIMRMRRSKLMRGGEQNAPARDVGRKGRRDIRKRSYGRKNKGRSKSSEEKGGGK